MSAHIKNRPLNCSVQSGANAKGFFQFLLALYFHREVKGDLYESTKHQGVLAIAPCTGARVNEIVTGLQSDQAFPGVDHFILDCTNQHGDIWRATYYMEYQVTTFVKNDSLESLRRSVG